jgi:hypothetical protein
MFISERIADSWVIHGKSVTPIHLKQATIKSGVVAPEVGSTTSRINAG